MQRFTRPIAICATFTAAGLALRLPSGANAAEKPLHNFAAAVLSPNGRHVAAIENDDPALEGDKAHQALTIRNTSGGPPVIVPLPCGEDVDCVPSSPAWSPDSATLSFVLKSPKTSDRKIMSVDAAGTDMRTR